MKKRRNDAVETCLFGAIIVAYIFLVYIIRNTAAGSWGIAAFCVITVALALAAVFNFGEKNDKGRASRTN